MGTLLSHYLVISLLLRYSLQIYTPLAYKVGVSSSREGTTYVSCVKGQAISLLWM